jgi:hypothetical protein
VKLLNDAAYRGFLTLEYEAKEPVATAVPKYLQQLRALL